MTAEPDMMDRLLGLYAEGRPAAETEVRTLRADGRLDTEQYMRLLDCYHVDVREARMGPGLLRSRDGEASARFAGDTVIAAFVTSEMDYRAAVVAIATHNVDGSFGVGDVRREVTLGTLRSLRTLRSAWRSKVGTPATQRAVDQLVAVKRELLAKADAAHPKPMQKMLLRAEIEKLAAAAVRTFALRVAVSDDGPRDVAEELTAVIRRSQPRLFRPRTDLNESH